MESSNQVRSPLGYYSALLDRSEIGDINRFPFGDSLCSYGSFIPSTYTSEAGFRHGGIVREGSRWPRWCDG
jgi:hypothetical protein